MRSWLAEREADLLPVGYFHVVFSVPAEIAAIAWRNKAPVYDPLFRAAAETMMTIRRFLLHVLPRGFHRIRHYGLLASAMRKDNIARIRQMLGVPQPVGQETPTSETTTELWCRRPCCGGTMVIIEILARSIQPRAPPTAPGSAGRWVS